MTSDVNGAAASPETYGKPSRKMDKRTLNNTIVSLRPIVVQAKVHCIHHLTAIIKEGEPPFMLRNC